MPAGWDATRAAVLARDVTCRLRLACHGAPAAEVHHAVPGSEAPADLWGVCGPCHQIVTAAQAAAARALAR
jgi:5-methylcytosine-specific restriction endonuclease McrA